VGRGSQKREEKELSYRGNEIEENQRKKRERRGLHAVEERGYFIGEGLPRSTDSIRGNISSKNGVEEEVQSQDAGKASNLGLERSRGPEHREGLTSSCSYRQGELRQY